MTRTKTCALFGALIVTMAQAGVAAPTITNVTGSFSDNNTVQISGSAFKDKSPAAPLVWADFESGLNPAAPGQKTNWSYNYSMEWSPEGYSGSKGAKAANSSGKWILGVDYDAWTREGQRFYIFRRQKINFVVSDNSHNWKTWRMWPSDSGGYPNIYAATNNGRVFVEKIGQESGYWAPPLNSKSTDWVAEEFIGRASNFNVKDGVLTVKHNGRQVANGSIMTRSSVTPAYMKTNYAVHGMLANKGSWNPPWKDSNRMWIDDVYIDTTWARVMLGDAATFEASTKFEMQIPTAWADGSVTVVANTNSFPSGSVAYLYVIDKEGNVNSSGYRVTVGGSAGGTPNQAPVVDAGNPLSIALPAPAALNGVVSDDGKPTVPGRVTARWELVNGPGLVSFTNPELLNTSASFSQPGNYELKLTATDGQFSSEDTMVVTVNPAGPGPGNQPPTVNAGPDFYTAVNRETQLNGAIIDDGLPHPPAIGSLWEKVSGPSLPVFTDAAQAVTTVRFLLPGVYVLRLSAGDGTLAGSDEVTVTVVPAGSPVPTPSVFNRAPTAEAGKDMQVPYGAPAVLLAKVSDDGMPNGKLTQSWSQVSGPGVATFTDPLKAKTAAHFSQPGMYVLRITAFDGEYTGHSDVKVNVQTAPQQSQVTAVKNVINPTANESAEIGVNLNQPSFVDVKVYDRSGGLIKSIGESRPAGFNQILWNGRNDSGSVVASGIYLVAVKIDNNTQPYMKVVVLK